MSTQRRQPPTFVDVIQDLAEAAGERPAYTFLEDRPLRATATRSWADLDRRARAVAASLQALAPPGARVLLALPPGLDFVDAFFGCLYAGAVAVPAPLPRRAHHPRGLERLRGIADDCGAAVVATTTGAAAILDGGAPLAPERLLIDEVPAEAGASWRRPGLDPDGLAWLQYTSGSTSRPRGVMVSHRNALVNCRDLARASGSTSGDVSLSWPPTFHDMGLVIGVLLPAWLGIPAYLMAPLTFLRRPGVWLEAISRFGATISCGANFAYDLCVAKVPPEERASLDLRRWRMTINGAEPVSAESIERFHRAFASAGLREEVMLPAYGLAEATLVVSVGPAGRPPSVRRLAAESLVEDRVEPPAAGGRVAAVVGCGRPIENAEVAIVGPDERPAPEATVGEVWVRGAAICAGYWQNPEATAETFDARLGDHLGTTGGWLRTGDLGFLADGELFITGRAKDLIIVAGENHYPQDIERTVEACHPAILGGRCNAFGVERDDWRGERLVVAAEVRVGPGETTTAILDAIRQAVWEGHELAVHGVALLRKGAIPRTTSGKLQRRACRAALLAGELPTVEVWWAPGTAPEPSPPAPLPQAGEGRKAEEGPARPSADAITAWLVARLAAYCGVATDAIDVAAPFARFGLESKDAVGLAAELETLVGRPLPETLLWDRPTIRELARHLAGEAPRTEERAPSPQPTAEPGAAVAIIGLACRFPGAGTPEALWELLRQGGDAVTEVPAGRWDGGDELDPGFRRAGFLGDAAEIAGFDDRFFGVVPAEAREMDPQHRILLEVGWEALERAAVAPSRLGARRCGVYVAVGPGDYAALRASQAGAEPIGEYTAVGAPPSLAAGRIAYGLGLTGPALTVDTACSSSLVALHLAVQALRAGDCDLAVVGGVNLLLSPQTSLALARRGALSPTGRCHAFSDDADGYVRGEGCGVVVLERLDDAVARRDRVWAVVRGTAVNNDGRSYGLTAPNAGAQTEVIRAALADAAVEPWDVGYVEAHGTGTPLGDPQEIEALAEAYAAAESAAGASSIGPIGHIRPIRPAPLLVGSVKTNLGHLEAAAGIAGLIKAVLSLQAAEVAPHLHFRTPSRRIPWQRLAIEVADRARKWPSGRRLAGVSSFGFAGTNAHAILESAPPEAGPEPESAEAYLVCLGARTEAALDRRIEALEHQLVNGSSLTDLAFTAWRQEPFPHRLAVVAADAGELRGRLRTAREGRPGRGVARGRAPLHEEPKAALLFSGQGTGRPGMARAPWHASPVFRETLAECAEEIAAELDGRSPLPYLLADVEADDELRHDPAVIQPALFCLQVALVELWRSWGLRPAAVAGHSLGEYAAAWAAGVLSRRDAARLVAARARAISGIERAGVMVAALADLAAVERTLAESPGVFIAAVNGPRHVVVSGAEEAVAVAVRRLEAEGVECRRLAVSHAFHSPLVAPAAAALTRAEREIEPRPPSIPWVSSLTGEIQRAGLAPGYFARQTLEPVRLDRALPALAEAGCRGFLEIGPAPALTRLGPEGLTDPDLLWVASLRRQEPWRALLGAAAQLHVRGHTLDLAPHYERLGGRVVDFPGHPLERRAFWFRTQPMETSMERTPAPPPADSGRIADALRGIVGGLLELPPEAIDIDTPLLEMGADSLALLQGINAIESRFGVRLTVRQIFEELPTLRRVAEHVALQTPAPASGKAPEMPAVIPPAVVEPPAPSPASPPPAAAPAAPAIDLPAGDLNALFARQLDAFTQLTARQIEALGRVPATAAPAAPPVVEVAQPTAPPAVRANEPADMTAGGALGERQERFLSDLAARYNRRTAGSKRYAARYRPVLADLRWYYGFRPSMKEMVYPLVKGRARGSRIWDVDGNEYVDLTLGYGVHLLGHAPPLVEAAVRRQLDEGFELGPRSPLAGEAAELLCEITGFERATFCVSGTEAVLLALRLARAATGRTRFVMFEGAYHGHGDATQMRRAPEGGGRAEPSTPGVPAALAADAAVFAYGSEEALAYVEAHGRELAAVLVEPVRSRFPELQPAGFLHRLRELTAASGTALIFDEMITGFRVHPAGAQGVFGIRADLATYGKILGGGMPVGAVAGAARFLDRMDGGAWRYGDASGPDPDVTYFGATHALHPLSMAAAKAVLEHLRTEGPGLQEDLNRRTDELMERLNAVFRREEAPIRMVNFGSLFRFEFAGNRDPLFYLLAERGVYVWEGRTCFLSTAHGAGDLDHVVAAVEESVPLLRDGGFLPPRRGQVAVGAAAPPPAAPPDTAPRRAGMPWQRRAGASLLAPRAGERSRPSAARASSMDFSLFYFGSYDPDPRRDKYRLLFEGARFADARGFSAVWIPERHFHAFGGLSPNPSVVAAALARETRRIGLRAGSVVLPLHHPVRVAEEWSVVDNLSGGRAGISIASGWHAGDFVFDPGAYAGRRDEVVRRLELVQRLWRGETVPFPGPDGRELEARLVPRPLQPELRCWLSVVSNPESWERAGELGVGILTSLLGQSLDDVAANAERYREAFARSGHDPARAHVALLLHTFVGDDLGATRARARAPFRTYLEAATGLLDNLVSTLGTQDGFGDARPEDRDYLFEKAYERYAADSALIGTPESCAEVVEAAAAIGVDEICCLIDFGVDDEEVLAGLEHLDRLRQRFAGGAPGLTYPATLAQRQLYHLAALGPGGSLAYNLYTALDLEGRLDRAALDAALDAVVRRHEALRTTFDPGGETLRVHADLPAGFDFVDFAGQEPDARRQALADLLEEEGLRRAPLESGPVLHARLVRLDEERHVLVLRVHHALVDGWSLGVLVEEIATLYSAARRGGGQDAMPEPPAFSGHAAWQAEQAGSPAFAEDEAFWLREIDGVEPGPLLPFDAVPAGPPAFRGGRVTRPLAVDGLAALARRQRLTPFMVLFGSFAALLHRLSGRRELAIAVPAANRRLPGDAHLVGYCTHLMPIRSSLAPGATGLDLLAGARSRLLAAYEHQHYPYARLVERLKERFDPLRAPLLGVVFNLDRPVALPAMEGLTARLRPTPITHTQLDLSVNVLEEGGRLTINCDFSRDRFERATVERLLDRWQRLLADLIEEPETAAAELPLMTDAERAMLLDDWGQGSALRHGAPIPLVDRRFLDQVERLPRAIAVRSGDETLTFAELERASRRLAWRLRRLGVEAETPVGIYLPRSPRLVVAVLAVLRAGGAFLPLDRALPERRLAHLLRDAGAPLVVTEASLRGNLPADVETVVLDNSPEVHDEGSPLPPLAPDRLAYVIYTSGSTGEPKGVEVEHASFANYLAWMERAYAGHGGSGAPLHATLAFDGTLTSFFHPLVAGETLDLLSEADPVTALARRLADPAAPRYALVKVTPTHLRLLDELLPEPQPIQGPGALVVGGEAFDPELAHRWRRRLPATRLVNEYGPTEATVACTLYAVRGDERGPIPIGRPAPGASVVVLDAERRLVPAGVPGEIFVGGSCLARGYRGNPEATRERFGDDPSGPGRLYRTGDLGRWSTDGQLLFLGRADDQVKVRGQRIELGEVEAVLARHPAVAQCAAAVRRDERDEDRLVAWFVAASGSTPDVGALRTHLERFLPPAMVPAALARIDALPVTASGKVDRKALPWSPAASERSHGEPTEPADRLERELLAIWSRILGVPGLTPRDRFADVGGDSVQAVRLMAEVRRALGIEGDAALVLEHPTVAAMARHLRTRAESPEGGHLAVLREGAAAAPLYLVHPIGGHLFCYQRLCRELAPGRRVEGLRAHGLAAGETPLRDVSALADLYLREVVARQPAGPYLLGGWSFGGVIAFEMARRLRARGATVPLVALVDAHLWNEGTIDLSNQETWMSHLVSTLTGIPPEEIELPAELGDRSQDEIVTLALERLARRGRNVPHLAGGDVRRSIGLVEAHVEALRTYAPEPYETPGVVLFRTGAGSPLAATQTAAWRRVAPALQVVDLPGDHFTLLDDHAPLTAHRLDAAIARAEAPGGDGGTPGDALEPVVVGEGAGIG